MTQTEILIWIAFWLAQIADVLTTRAFLEKGIPEANPIWRWMQDRIGDKWWAPRLVVAGGLAAGLQLAFGTILPVAVIAVGIFGVAIWNAWQIRRAE